MSFQNSRMLAPQEWAQPKSARGNKNPDADEGSPPPKFSATNGFLMGSPAGQVSDSAAASIPERPPSADPLPPVVSPIHNRDDEMESWLDLPFGEQSFCLDFFGEPSSRQTGNGLQLPKDGGNATLDLPQIWGDVGPSGKDLPNPFPPSSTISTPASCLPPGRPATAAAAMAHAAGRAAGLEPLQSAVEVFSEVRTYVHPGTRKWGKTQHTAGRGDRPAPAMPHTSAPLGPRNASHPSLSSSFPSFDPGSCTKMTMSGRFPHFSSQAVASFGWENPHQHGGGAVNGMDLGLQRVGHGGGGQQPHLNPHHQHQHVQRQRSQQLGSVHMASECMGASRYTASSSMVSSGADSSTTLMGREAASVVNLSGECGRGGRGQLSKPRQDCLDVGQDTASRQARAGGLQQQHGGLRVAKSNSGRYCPQENLSGQTESDVCKSGEDMLAACNRMEDTQETFSLNTSEGPRSGDQRGSQERSGTRSSGKGRRLDETEDDGECQLQENVEEGSGGTARQAKRSRASEVHNLSERRRRDRINERMKALQELIPNSNKTDKASMLDEAIEYIKMLQLQLQVMSMRCGVGMSPMMVPGPQMMGHWNPHMGPEMQQMQQMGMFHSPGMMGPFNPGHVVNMQPMMEAVPSVMPWGVGLQAHSHDTMSPGPSLRGLEG